MTRERKERDKTEKERRAFDWGHSTPGARRIESDIFTGTHWGGFNKQRSGPLGSRGIKLFQGRI